MLLLSIDTSTRGCSVAIHQNSQLLAAYELYTDKSSSAMLTTLIQNVVVDSGFSLHEIDGVVVAKGPGSYTGLRVGVSTAKGVCYSLDKPLVAINTLEAMFMQVKGYFGQDVLFCPMIDARRMEVYAATFNSEGNIIEPTQAVIIQENSFADLLKTNKIVFFGDGADKCKTLFSGNSNAIFISEEIRPSAKTVGILGSHAFQNGVFEDVAAFEPYYLKDFMTPPSRKTTLLV